MNELHLFSGAGGGILGGQLLGHRCLCAVESEPYAQSILVARQDDGSLSPFPIFPDVCTFDGRPWRGIADIVAGGFPCQDIQRRRQRRRHRRRAIRALGTHGADRGRGSTPLRLRGKQPSAPYSGTRKSARRPGRARV